MKKPRRARFLGPIGTVLLASLTTGCASNVMPTRQPPEETARVTASIQVMETMVTATLNPIQTPTAAPTPKAVRKPTPRPTARPRASQVRLTGNATWYRYVPGGAAAGPLLRKALGSHWRGRTVTVCANGCVRVTLSDWCLCSHGRRVIDLDSRAFAAIGHLSAGVIAVRVKW